MRTGGYRGRSGGSAGGGRYSLIREKGAREGVCEGRKGNMRMGGRGLHVQGQVGHAGKTEVGGL
jgi:hypothetical protein